MESELNMKYNFSVKLCEFLCGSLCNKNSPYRAAQSYTEINNEIRIKYER